MKMYKGFDKNLQCRGFQFEVGKTYETDKAELCEVGFHACEAPLNVLRYYSSATSRYCEVTLDDVSPETGDDTKRVGKKITIDRELSFAELVQAHIAYAAEAAGCLEAAHTGCYSAVTKTGDGSVVVNTGYCSAATSTGDGAVTTNTGDCSTSVGAGDGAVTINTGDCSASVGTGYDAVTINTGNNSVAANRGNHSTAKVDGKASVALASGYQGKVQGALGCAIMCVERGKWDGSVYPILAAKAAIVDGETIKANTWYTVKSGEWAEVEQ